MLHSERKSSIWLVKIPWLTPPNELSQIPNNQPKSTDITDWNFHWHDQTLLSFLINNSRKFWQEQKFKRRFRLLYKMVGNSAISSWKTHFRPQVHRLLACKRALARFKRTQSTFKMKKAAAVGSALHHRYNLIRKRNSCVCWFQNHQNLVGKNQCTKTKCEWKFAIFSTKRVTSVRKKSQSENLVNICFGRTKTDARAADSSRKS